MREIGIIIPTFNRKDFLHEAVESLLTQALPPDWDFQIVVVDDGSSDGTFSEMCETYGAPRPTADDVTLSRQLTILRKENGERGAARNYGAQWLLRQRKVDWLLFFDADDIMIPGSLYRFAKRIEDAEGRDFGAVYAEINIWASGPPIAGGKAKSGRPEGDLAQLSLVRHILPLGATLVRAELFQELNGFSEDRRISGSEDWLLLCRLSFRAQVLYSSHVAVNYRQHSQNTPLINYFHSLDQAFGAIEPDVRERFRGREVEALKKLMRRASLVKVGTVNSRGLWREALVLFGRSLEADPGLLLDKRTHRISLSIAKRALLNFKSMVLPGHK